MPVLNLARLEDTTLWRRLASWPEGDDDAQIARMLLANLLPICQQASDRMKSFPALHPEHTLHDEPHLLRVTELMAKVMGAEVVRALNPVEIFLLVLAAHFHDQGMVLDGDEIRELEARPDFLTFRDTWVADHPNLRDVRAHLLDRGLSDEERSRYRRQEHELEAALVSDYVRRGHGPRSAAYVRREFATDGRWEVARANVAELVARLCDSHTEDALDLVPGRGFRHDESVGSHAANMAYLGLVLRLADILDFDRDRTPDVLFRSITFSSPVSLAEWEKHRSVQGWTISPEVVRFTMRCEHPAYQRSALRFMDWIDEELTKAHELVAAFPAPTAARYRLGLPLRVDRSRIEPKDRAYTYFDLEFSLSRDEIVRLLMTDRLYRSPSLCVRELLQNALDALRYRRALIKRDTGADWTPGEVVMEHGVDEAGHEVLRCTDNGAGMDEGIVVGFLTKVGRSFYRSPDFARERESFARAGVDFDPCAQFGIGFMSAFMVGDRIVIRTRRDYGPARGAGRPLVVEINGLSGMLVVRPGDEGQPVGTTVEITGRKKPRFFEKWDDRILLADVLNGYALACEFPITGRCTIPEIRAEIAVPASPSVPRTAMESAGISGCRTVEQPFAEIHKDLGGSIRAGFLIDPQGRLTTANDEAAWTMEEESSGEMAPTLVTAGGEKIRRGFFEGRQVCLDGILVGGEPGREGRSLRLGSSPGRIELGSEQFVVDVRGALKPPITPARTPQDERWDGQLPAGWQRLQALANRARGRLWETVATLPAVTTQDTFWELALIHRMDVSWMRAGSIWGLLSVPVLADEQEAEWRPISALGTLEAVQEGDALRLATTDGKRIGAPDRLTRWDSARAGWSLAGLLISVVASISTFDVSDGRTLLHVVPPSIPDCSPAEDRVESRSIGMTRSHQLHPFGPTRHGLLAAQTRFGGCNRDHPLSRIALESQFLDERTDIQQYARSALFVLGEPGVLEWLGQDDHGVNYGMRHLGRLYLAVDWDRYARDLRPPYGIWTQQFGIRGVTSDDLVRWAHAERVVEEDDG